MTRVKLWAALAALMGAFAFVVPAANAAPAATGLTRAATETGGVQTVHWRGWRHCHWRHGYRRCHGFHGYRRGPGIYFRFGKNRRHYWRGRDRDRGWRRDRD